MPALRKRKKIDMAEPEDSGSEYGDEGEVVEEVETETQPKTKTPSKPRAPKVAKTTTDRAAQGGNTALPEDCNILDVVKQPRGALASLAKSWAHDYQADRSEATAALLTFVVQAAGGVCEVTADEVEEGETDKLMRRILLSAHEEGIDDHFKGKGAKAFADNYREWWELVVREAAAVEILFDSFVLERLLNLVTLMASSTIRNFRTAATIGAMQLMTSLVRVMNTLTEATETSQRQLDAEKKRKGGGRVATERALRRAVDQSHHRMTDLKATVESTFDSVGAQRFRDVAEEVRATVIDAIGGWIMLRPAMFLEDRYLKYLGWALSDKDAVVRLAAATALVELYGVDDHVPLLHKFTTRFASRYAELIYDLNEAVSVKGIQLMTRLAALEEVEGTAMQDVYRLLVDDSAAVRHAAADLVADLLPSHGRKLLSGQDRPTPKKGRGGRRTGAGVEPTETELHMAGLLYIAYLLANNEEDDEETVERRQSLGTQRPELALDPGMAAHVVDALLDKVELLGSDKWREVVAVLEAGTLGGQDLTGAQATNLLLLLHCTVRRAAGATLVPARHEPRKASKAAVKAAEDAQHTATLLFARALPGLITTYQTDPVQAAALVGILGELQMEVWALKSEEKVLGSLLQQIADMFLKHVEVAPLSACAVALAHATRTGTDSTQAQASRVMDTLSGRVAAALKKAAQALDSCSDSQLVASPSARADGPGDAARNVGFQLNAALVRAEQLLTMLPHLASHPAFLQALRPVLRAASEGRELGLQIIGAAARCALLVIMWRLTQLRRDCEGGVPPSAADVEQAADLRSTLVSLLEATLRSTEEDAVREAVLLVLGDLYLLLSPDRLSGPLEALAYEPSHDAVHDLWQACEDVLAMHVDEASQPEDEASISAAQEAVQQRHEAVALVAGRLAVFGGGTTSRPELAAQLLSHAVAHGPAVEAATKEVCKFLRKGDPSTLPRAYAGAITAAWERHQDGAAPLEEFTALADRVAASYVGFNASAPAVALICTDCGDAALADAPTNLGLLEGLKSFVGKLAPAAAAAWAAHLRTLAQPQGLDQASEDWRPLLELLDLLQDRATKGKTPKGTALKTGPAGIKGPLPLQSPSSSRPTGRRINFAAASETPDPSTPSTHSHGGGEEVTARVRGRQQRATPQREQNDAIEEPEEFQDLRAASHDMADEEPTRAGGSTARGGKKRRGHVGPASPPDASAEEEPASRPKVTSTRKKPVMKALYAEESDHEEDAGKESSDDEAQFRNEAPLVSQSPDIPPARKRGRRR